MKVLNPFADQLIYPAHGLKMRREQKKYLTLLKAVALLHQYQRPVKRAEQDGVTIEYVEATQEDLTQVDRSPRALWRGASMNSRPRAGSSTARSRRLIACKKDAVTTNLPPGMTPPESTRLPQGDAAGHGLDGLAASDPPQGALRPRIRHAPVLRAPAEGRSSGFSEDEEGEEARASRPGGMRRPNLVNLVVLHSSKTARATCWPLQEISTNLVNLVEPREFGGNPANDKTGKGLSQPREKKAENATNRKNLKCLLSREYLDGRRAFSLLAAG